MKVPRSSIKVGRVLAEDSDFVTLEVAKRDTASFTLQRDESGETVGGDRFMTLVFLHGDATGMVTWDPFEAE